MTSQLNLPNIPSRPEEFFKFIKENKEYIDKNQYNKKQSNSDIVVNETIKKEINSLTITEEEVKAILGRKWQHNLALIGAFINKYQYITSDKELVALPISSTNDFMLTLCGTNRNASKFIDKLKQVKLLTQASQIIEVEKLVLDENGKVISKEVEKKEVKYSYKRKLSSVYYYSKSIQNIIKNIIDKNQIVIKQNKITNNESNINTTKVELFANNKDFELLKDRVKFSSKLSIPCVAKDMSSLIKPVLKEAYPLLSYFQQIADDMNEELNYANQIKFKPDIKYDRSNKYVKKISIRATNPLVSSRSDREDIKPNFCGKFRDEVLKEQLGDTWYEFDVKSSVPKVAKLMNTGVWLDNKIDMYKEMYKEMCALLEITPYSDEEYAAHKVRDNFKDAFMRNAFDKSPATMTAHIVGAWMNPLKDVLSKKELYEYNEKMKDISRKYFTAYVAASNKVVGDIKDTEVFLHESCIYLLVAKKIRERGIKLVQIYDGFYTDKEVEDIEQLVKECALEYYEMYTNNNKNKTNSNKYTTKVELFAEEHDEVAFDDISALASAALEMS